MAETSRIESEFKKKFSNDKIIDDLFAAFIFQSDGNLQTLLHELKYKKRFRIGNFLGKILAEYIAEQVNNWDIHFIVPMPLHKLKKAERGYNQSDHIASALGRTLNIPVKNRLIKRIRFTESQTKLNLLERRENIAGAFKVKSRTTFTGKNILILDDVITTGASVTEVGKVLKQHGASKVIACSVALAD
jgi:ComF family protein